ncbi:unnamed protein product [Echinostoma caproni]|uniref:Tyrosine-protein phosphatase domain-containing protein n=1 Tax=Echinostoma caproni TaxID=27848 RepID=A0A182ZZD4_9TREM|nr:unnamed protein product [Echinostoma caproni]
MRVVDWYNQLEEKDKLNFEEFIRQIWYSGRKKVFVASDGPVWLTRGRTMNDILNTFQYSRPPIALKDVYFIWQMVQASENSANPILTFIGLAKRCYSHFYTDNKAGYEIPPLEERQYFVQQLYKHMKQKQIIIRVKEKDQAAPPQQPPVTFPVQPPQQLEVKLDPREHLQKPPMAKRPAMDADVEFDEDGGGRSSNAGALQHANDLFKIHYYKFEVTLTRKQHLTVAQYKPADTGITQFYVTCIPYQFFEFRAVNDDGIPFRDPYGSIQNAFDYCHFDTGHIRPSYFVPPQHSLTGTTQQDVPALNTTPYAYLSQDNLGILRKLQQPHQSTMIT